MLQVVDQDGDAAEPRLIVVQNWLSELNRLVPMNGASSRRHHERILFRHRQGAPDRPALPPAPWHDSMMA